jgi:flagellar hook-associated protein 2
MGTVGLSFGSTTNRQGFDVATTVTQILASEKAIETPWNTQLTALKAQDTVLTALGTDLSALSTSLQALTDFQGVFSAKLGASSNTNVLDLTSASATAVAGSHTIEITQLAQTSSNASTAVSAANNTLSGTLTIQGQTFNVNSTNNNDTLSSLSAAINSADIGVTASVITDSSGSRLSIVSGTSGAAGQLTISASLTDASSNPVTFPSTSGQAGQDANLKVDGVSVTSPSNTVTTVIPGITFQLLALSTTPVQVQITDDTTSIGTAISSFLSAYNKVIGDINTQEGKDSSGNPEPLMGSPVLAQLQGALTGSLFTGAASGSIKNITQLGISMNNDGTLTLNGDTLNTALNSHLADVTGFLQNSGSFGQMMSTTLNNLGTQAPNGSIYLVQQQNAAQETALNTDISNEDALLSAQQTQLTNELNTANQILQSIPSQLNQINEIYSAITGYNQNQNG